MNGEPRRRLASEAVSLRAVPLIAAALLVSGCGLFDAPDAQYAGVCMDPTTNLRLPDERCGDYDDEGYNGSDGGAFFLWMPMTYGGGAPAVGKPMPRDAGAVRRVPSGTPIVKGVPPAGGSMPSIVRGGLGVKSGTTGGVGGRSSGGGS